MAMKSSMRAGSKVGGSVKARQWKTPPAGMPPPPWVGWAWAASVAVASAWVGWAAWVGASVGAAAGGVAVGSVPPQAAIMGISSTKSTNAISFFENILSFPPKVSLKLCAPALVAWAALRNCCLDYLVLRRVAMDCPPVGFTSLRGIMPVNQGISQ